MSGLHFEELRFDLERLSVPEGYARSMRWLTEPLAVGRTATGDYEIFLRGNEIRAASSLVRRHLQHSEWRPEDSEEKFAANRIVLPSAPHFSSIAALIAIELIRAGISNPENIQSAFTDVEPIIEMAIRRGALPENVVIGLIGELTVLRQIILSRRGSAAGLMRALECWRGWQDTASRDFRLGCNSIEVKTTRMASSIHQFSGLHQLESELLQNGVLENLHLISIGLTETNLSGETLPMIVDNILYLLQNSAVEVEVADEFLRRLSRYGSQSGSGYVHSAMRDWSVYKTNYVHTFAPRLYRIDDPEMRLLSRAMLSNTFVQTSGLSFTMHFPDRVSAFNPAVDWSTELASMAEE
ncbi:MULTISPECIES: PD-(D/E)XK motif protein [Roseobacteraceae]|uniref:PD-(D/E)XK motif protein n=1 Tax=Roseobacteraceae TaxID=2854170 RepID=UPI0031D94B35